MNVYKRLDAGVRALASRLCSRVRSADDDLYFKGSPRPYSEAKSLFVIDQRIASLVDVMNCHPVIWTTASCEGHGWGFIKTSPYVAFKCSTSLAASFEELLRRDVNSSNPRLNYFWELVARFDQNFDLTFVLEIPGISSGRWFYATRGGIDNDLKLIELMFKNEIFNHLKSQQIKFESKEQQHTNYNNGQTKSLGPGMLIKHPTHVSWHKPLKSI